MFIVVNGQILNNSYNHLVTLRVSHIFTKKFPNKLESWRCGTVGRIINYDRRVLLKERL